MIIEKLHLIPCQPPLWAIGGHAQTMVGFCLPSPKIQLLSEVKILPLPDGDSLSLLYTQGSSNCVFYLFHGLTGDASVNYMKRAAKTCSDRGHSVYRVNHRGCGEGLGLAVNPYHSGRGEDVSEVIAFGRREHPNKKHIAIGFSMSGNVLLTLLTELRGSVLPDYAITVNAPIDLSLVIERLKKNINKLYDFHFVQKLRWTVRSQCNKVPFLSTLRTFDALYTAPAGGFKSVEDYYETCSTYQRLDKIQVPTILLTSEDDPFVPHETYRNAKLSPKTQLYIEKVGGHMGYISQNKNPLGSHRWLDYALFQCLENLLGSDF